MQMSIREQLKNLRAELEAQLRAVDEDLAQQRRSQKRDLVACLGFTLAGLTAGYVFVLLGKDRSQS